MSEQLYRTTEFVMSPVQAPSDTQVLYVKLSDGYLSLAKLEDIQALEQQLAEARALLQVALDFYSMREPQPADYARVVANMAKIRAFLHKQRG